jgi:hypothetical protein
MPHAYPKGFPMLRTNDTVFFRYRSFTKDEYIGLTIPHQNPFMTIRGKTYLVGYDLYDKDDFRMKRYRVKKVMDLRITNQ